jgi:hypothetical protein
VALADENRGPTVDMPPKCLATGVPGGTVWGGLDDEGDDAGTADLLVDLLVDAGTADLLIDAGAGAGLFDAAGVF